MTRWVVVLASSERCEEYPDQVCLMNALGPFGSNAEAKQVAAAYGSFRPHILILDDPPR